MKNLLQVLFIFLLVLVFFWQFFVKGFLPIPSDTIIGLYHPFRDLYSKNYPNGIPYKNYLITDPVRQQYPWKELAISMEKRMELPLWNPYSFSGTPLLANFQSAPFYIFNILFFLVSFPIAWSLIIFLGPMLGGVFLYFYLDNLRLNKFASVLGAITFSFSGFFIAWMEWGTIGNTAMWLPLILLSIDKLYSIFLNKESINVGSKKLVLWSFIFIFSLISSFFAGHLQVFFYAFILQIIYFFSKWFSVGGNRKILGVFVILNLLFIIFSSIQWIPTLQFIFLSARSADNININNPGWFIPWQNLIQFIAPDFFGNPSTLNYWGVWNYGELVPYVGIAPLLLSLFAIFFRYDKKTLFFGAIFFISLIFGLPTIFAKMPFFLGIPFLDTAQPTRLIFLVDFSLAVLASLGLDYYLKKNKNISYILMFFVLIFLLLWVFVFQLTDFSKIISPENILVAKNNLKLPTLIFVLCVVIFYLGILFSKKNQNIKKIICVLVIFITAFDLLRFGWKFIPFTSSSYLFPSTKAIKFLQKNIGDYRIMSADERILPPNFSAVYGISSIDGYDPLYLLRYGELIASSERKSPDIHPPFGFNRIITPKNFDSKIINLTGVKYILSLSDIDSPSLSKVFQEGKTIIYENKNVLSRAYFVSDLVIAKDKNQAISEMFSSANNLSNTAIVENSDEKIKSLRDLEIGNAKISNYSENKVVINTENKGRGFLVLTDSFYPTWKAKVDGKESTIYRTDYNFRGVIIEPGKHKVTFYTTLF